MKSIPRRTTASKTKKTATPRHVPLDKALKTYEQGLKLFGRGEYAKSASEFNAVIKESPGEREICDRARIYLNLCKARTAGPAPKPKTAEEAYYQGILAANDGRLQEASQVFEGALKQGAGNEKLHYALASVNALMENRDGALANLGKAIELNRSNKVLALNDTDFDSLRDDPDFLALVGKAPEAGA